MGLFNGSKRSADPPAREPGRPRDVSGPSRADPVQPVVGSAPP